MGQQRTGAAAGYLGDPTVPHTVTGSPFGHNFVKIEGPNVGGPANPNPCPGLDANTSPDCIYTDLFSILGKKSTRGGVEVARASYSLAADAGAKPQIDVMAESKAGQDIVAQDTIVGSGRRFQVTPLATEQSRYFTHLNVQGALPDADRRDQPLGHPADGQARQGDGSRPRHGAVRRRHRQAARAGGVERQDHAADRT